MNSRVLNRCASALLSKCAKSINNVSSRYFVDLSCIAKPTCSTGKSNIMQDKVALITGGASGIGKQIVKELLQSGAMGVIIADINNINGENLAKRLVQEYGKGRVMYVKCDITKSDHFDWAFKQSLKYYKQLDLVVNNAGVLNDPKWEYMINTNIGGCVVGSLLGIQYMSRACIGNGGHIINIASTCGLVPASGLPIYTLTQSAIIGFSRALGSSEQYDRSGVKVVSLCVGPTETGMLRQAPNSTMNVKFKCELLQDMECMVTQKPEAVATGLISLLTKAETGSVWIQRCGDPVYEARVPEDIEELREESKKSLVEEPLAKEIEDRNCLFNISK